MCAGTTASSADETNLVWYGYSFRDGRQICDNCLVRAADKKAGRHRIATTTTTIAIRWIGAYSSLADGLETRLERELFTRDRQVACEVLASIEQSAVKGWIGVQADVRDVVRTYSGDSWTVPVGRHLKATRSYWKASPAEGLACAKADGHAYAEGTLSINWRAIGIVCRSSRPDCRKMASRIAGRHNLPVVFTCEEDTENG